MFRGQFVHNIDAKGRVSMPVRFREALSGAGDRRFVLTPAPFDACLHLFPITAWEAVEKSVSELPLLSRDAVRFRRIYISAAIECELDGSGRVLVPTHLREKAQLEREVLWAGMGRNIELWSKGAWDKALALSADDEAAFRDAVEQII